MSRAFDLVDFQKEARESHDPAKLYALWDDVSGRFERKEITTWQYKEMKDVIFPNLAALSSLKRNMNS